MLMRMTQVTNVTMTNMLQSIFRRAMTPMRMRLAQLPKCKDGHDMVEYNGQPVEEYIRKNNRTGTALCDECGAKRITHGRYFHCKESAYDLCGSCGDKNANCDADAVLAARLADEEPEAAMNKQQMEANGDQERNVFHKFFNLYRVDEEEHGKQIWIRVFAMILAFLWCAGMTFLVLIYTLRLAMGGGDHAVAYEVCLEKTDTVQWIRSIGVALVTDCFVTQPLKLIVLSLGAVLLF
eukprot:1001431_1